MDTKDPVTPQIKEEPITPDLPNNSVSQSDKGTSEDTPKKMQKQKGKKRKKIRDLTAPRQPLNGYVRYLNDRREQFRAENPNMAFSEITKTLAAEWTALPPDQKQQYLTAAEQDRERYIQELAAYKQSEAYRTFIEQQNVKKPKVEPVELSPIQQPTQPTITLDSDPTCFELPIFTEEFLDHNKSREAELRQLRKSNTDYEQQNATIQTYLGGLHNAIDKLSVETQQMRNNNAALKRHLQHLRTVFTSVFKNIPIPGLETPSIDDIDNFMTVVCKFVRDEPNHPVINKVRNAVSQLDIQA